jgi:cyclase
VVAAGSTVLLDLGDKKVDIIDFCFGQTGGDLWKGNPVIALKPALPWRGHAALRFAMGISST